MSFRSALLASAALVSTGAAFAADLPARAPAPAPYLSAAPLFTWTGFYMGLNAGAGFNQGDSSVSANITNPIYAGSGGHDSGFTGGAQIGYNMQFGSMVAGVEADINYLDRGNGSSGTFATRPTTTDYTDFRVNRGSADNWFGTVRGRLGFAFDRALIYGTGGLAYGGKRGDSSVTQRDFVAVGTTTTLTNLSGTGSSDNVGWTLGAGVEWAFNNAWSVKAEYLHVKLGDNDQSFRTLGGNTITVSHNNKFDVVRAGLNWRF